MTTALTTRSLAPPSLSIRSAAAGTIIATLPLTFALTIPVGFPLKIYELVLGAIVLIVLAEGRIRVAPGLRPYVEPLLLFLALATVVLVFRLVVRLDTFTTSGFESRAGPVGDGLLKLAYWALAVLAFVVVATETYESPHRVARIWCISAIVAAIYGWALAIPSALNLPAPILPGMEAAARITLGGREVYRGGTFQEGNFFALYLLTSFALALWLKWRKTAWFLALTVFITFSTSNVAGLVVMLGWLGLYQLRQARDVRVQIRIVASVLLSGVALIAILVASGYIGTIFIAKLTGAQFISGLDRLDLTVAGVRMTLDHPVVGVGLSQYGFKSRPYQLTDIFDVSRPVKPIATNSWIELAAETGLIGVGIIIAFGVRVWRCTRGPTRVMLQAGMIGLALGLFTFPAPTVTFLWAYCGFAVGLHLRERAIAQQVCAQ